MSQPLVTVVIPLHNHEAWVGEAIDSVVRQDYPNKRIIVIDDGSTDNSIAAVTRKLYKPQRININTPKQQIPALTGNVPNSDVQVLMVRSDKAQGPAAARNAGITLSLSDTDLFAFLDSDDMYSPGKLSKSVAIFQKDPDMVGVIYSDFDTINPDGLRLRQFKEPYSRERLLQECLVNCDSLISKRAIEQCGLFDQSLRTCEDYDLWLRISERFVMVHIPESLVVVRVGSHSSSSTVPNEIWQKCYARVFEKARERMNGQAAS
jgi:glycosyltransferase involved in cell wall biosynthesis